MNQATNWPGQVNQDHIPQSLSQSPMHNQMATQTSISGFDELIPTDPLHPMLTTPNLDQLKNPYFNIQPDTLPRLTFQDAAVNTNCLTLDASTSMDSIYRSPEMSRRGHNSGQGFEQNGCVGYGHNVGAIETIQIETPRGKDRSDYGYYGAEMSTQVDEGEFGQRKY